MNQAKQLLKAHKEGSLEALQRIRAFFPKLSDVTDTEIQHATFGLQDAQLTIAREYGFASWTRLKEEVQHQEQVAAGTPAKDLLFQILRTPDPTQTDIQRVDELLTADPSLISVKDDEGRTRIEALAARGFINLGSLASGEGGFSLLLIGVRNFMASALDSHTIQGCAILRFLEVPRQKSCVLMDWIPHLL